MASINKHYSRKVMRNANELAPKRWVRSKVPAYDWTTGGGFIVNKMIIHQGLESTCKTYFSWLAAREFQNYDWLNNVQDGLEVTGFKPKKLTYKNKDGTTETITMQIPTFKSTKGFKECRGKVVAVIDGEGTVDIAWAQHLGVDIDRLIIIVPTTGEEGINAGEALLRDPDICLVIVDSAGSIRPASEMDKPMEEQNMAVTARFWNRGTAKFQLAMNANPEDDATVLIINRLYDKVGLVFGNPETQANGKGLRYGNSINSNFSAGKIMREEVTKKILGRNYTIANHKNKAGKPHRTCDFFFVMEADEARGLRYGDIDVIGNAIELGCQLGIIDKTAGNYVFGRTKIKGRENFEDALREKPVLYQALLDRIYADATDL